ncbi:hypothetical protein GO496_04320 [Acidovorax citrulli]|nr:hypothetical protein [Paracidovorax citrulli]
MEASRAVESPDDEIYPSTGAQVPRSVRMGINPADGPLSTGAAMAVDTGVSDQMQQAAALAQAAEAGEKSGKAQKQEQPARSPLGADPETGEIPGSDDVANWSDAQLSEVFRGAQGRDVRIKLAQELSRRKAARAAEQSTPVKGTTDGPKPNQRHPTTSSSAGSGRRRCWRTSARDTDQWRHHDCGRWSASKDSGRRASSAGKQGPARPAHRCRRPDLDPIAYRPAPGGCRATEGPQARPAEEPGGRQVGRT